MEAGGEEEVRKKPFGRVCWVKGEISRTPTTQVV